MELLADMSPPTIAIPALNSFESQTSNDRTEAKQANFYTLFGTKGCLLYCNDRKNLQVLQGEGRQLARGVLKTRKRRKHFSEEENQSFTLNELEASLSSGCQSCKTFMDILQYASLLDHHAKNAMENCVFHISLDFRLTRKITIGDRLDIKEVVLFHPQGKLSRAIRRILSSINLNSGYRVQLQCMVSSEFLTGNTASDLSTNKAREWVQACNKHHKCFPMDVASLLPKRLIDVTNIWQGTTLGVKLIQQTNGQRGKYVCLSHCWGSTPIHCSTKTKTLADALNFIKFETLPKNFQDAIILTRNLGIQYIWIDSVCIVQDDKQDWEVQSGEMAVIYKNADLTIASVLSPDSTGGCFSQTMPDLKLSLVDRTVEPVVIGIRMCDFHGRPSSYKDTRARFPLFQRDWVFQERLLSRRLLYCNFGELEFSCLEGHKCECGHPTTLPPHPLGTRVLPSQFLNSKHRLLMARDTKISKSDLSGCYRWWRQIVSNYMNLNITYPNDILPALSGCARIFSRLSGDQYLAGLWKSSISEDLVWYIERRGDSSKPEASNTGVIERRVDRFAPKPRPPSWTAPSWSWASVALGQLVIFPSAADGRREKWYLRHLNWTGEVKPKGLNSFGELSPGASFLRVEAPLFPCFVHAFCHRNIRALTADQRIRSAVTVAKRYNIYHRYKRRSPDLRCQIAVPELDSWDGLFRFLPDIPPDVGLQYNKVQTCNCALAKVWLFHVGRRWNNFDCLDYLMMLKETDSYQNKYERFGMVLYNGHSIEKRTRWFSEVWENDKTDPGHFFIV